MRAVTEGAPWATKMEANAQQMRRLSNQRKNLLEELPPLLPLARPPLDSAPPPSEQAPPSYCCRSTTSQARPRTSTAEGEQQVVDGVVVPSLSTLNREFDRLFLAHAGMREEANDVQPLNAVPHHSGRLSRRTSAPAAQRPLLSQRSRPESRMNASAVIASNTAEPQQRSFSAAPPMPPLPQISTLFRRRDSNAPTSEGCETKLKSWVPSRLFLPLETHTSIEVNDPTRVEPSTVSAMETCAIPPTPPEDGTTTAATNASEGKESKDHYALSPRPRNPKAKNGATETEAASTSPGSKGKGRDGRIMVVVRKRPLAADEEGSDCFQVNDPHVRIAVTKQRVDLSNYEECSDYIFDHAYDASANNSDVYTSCVKDLLTVSLAGGSASCFAYGQTGSGKTYTMMGTDTESGLYLLAAGDLFGRLGAGQQLSVCFYEIYCNSLFDLLNRRHPIVLREDANRRVNICGVVWRTVTNVGELWKLMRVGLEQRHTGSTSANEHSSRSHAIFSIRIKDAAHLDFMGTINFVDLAGSERAADTAANDRLTRLESAEINKSLLALKECIRALDEKRKHVPFRGSRLTEVLRDSFSGNSKTVMIATVSPGSHNYEHSNNTLRYAFRVKGLSIASVKPSKARNAPRPYIPVARSRSSAEPEERPAIAPSLTKGIKRKDGSDLADGAAGTPMRQRQGRKHRHSPRKSRINTGNLSTAAAMSELMEMMELNSMAAVRARRASQQYLSSTRQRNHASHGQDISSLLPVKESESVSRRRTQLPIYKAPPANLPPLISSTRSSSSITNSSPTGHVLPLPHLNSKSPPHGAVDVAALERRLTRKIMLQLRRDLGKQLDDVLSEKNATIAALRRENQTLRKALECANRENGRSESSLSLQEMDGRHIGTSLLPFSPQSPSILHEQSSVGASVSSVSDDAAYHVI